MKYRLISQYREELMGIAILNVLVLHTLAWTNFTNPSWLRTAFSCFGSLIFTEGFLFLSGFGIYYSLSKKQGGGTLDYYLKRIQRLLIPYWIMVLPFFLVWCAIGKYGVGEFILRLTTLQFWFHGNYSGMWYISVSVVLYFLSPLLFKSIEKKGGIVILLIASYCLLWLLHAIEPNYYKMTLIGLVKIPFFILGLWTGKQSLEDKKCHWIWLVLIIVLWELSQRYISCSWIFPAQDLYKIIGIVLCCLILAWTEKVHILHSFLKWFGSYTLEIYILHLMFFEAFSGLITNINIHIVVAVGGALSLCVPVHRLCSYVSQKIIETKKR